MKILTTDQELKDVLNLQSPFVIDIYSDTCQPCRMMLPVIEKVEKEYENVGFFKVNSESLSTELLQELDITSVPTFIFGNKDTKSTFTGVMPLIGFRSAVDAVCDSYL